MANTIKTYRQVVQQLLTSYVQIPYSYDDLVDEAVFDHKADRYLLLTMGWQGETRVHTCMIHLDIRDGKVWLQCNNTDQNIVQELVEYGIAREDIILPKRPRVKRQSNYAVATMPMAVNHLSTKQLTHHPLPQL